MSKTIKNMIAGVAGAITSSPFGGDSEIASTAVSMEDFSGEALGNSSVAMGNFEDKLVESVESADFPEHAIHAASVAAARAVSPSVGANVSRKLPQVHGVTVSVEADNIPDAISATEISVESFDGKDPAKIAALSYTFNAFASKQDSAAELLFPTFILGADKSALAMTVDIEQIQASVLRNNASPDAGKFGKVSLIKAFRDSSLLVNDKNALIPVRDAKSTSLLYGNQAETISHPDTKEAIETAPILFGKNVPLLGISQTPGQLNKGVADETDAIDPSVSIRSISAALDTEEFKFDLSAYPGNNFTYSTQGDSKDFILNFTIPNFVISLDDVKTAGGVVSPTLNGLDSHMKAYYEVVLNGKGNGAEGDIQVFDSAFTLVALKDENGQDVDQTAGAGAAAVAELAKISLKGYTLEAYATNSNLRRIGDLLTVSTITHMYQVPFRSPITTLAPINDGGHTSNDSKFLKTMINKAGLRTSLAAIDAVTAHADTMKTHKNNGLSMDELPSSGLAKYSVNPFFESANIDLSTQVDSQNANDRLRDIKATISNKVKDVVQRMATNTGYSVAHRFANAGISRKIGVAVVCGEDIAGYLGEEMDFGSNFEVKVESSPNLKMTSKFFVTFVDLGSDRNKEPNELAYGVNAWSPEIVAETQRTSNGAPVRALTITPVFRHIVLLDILAEFTVSNVTAVLGKVSANRHAV